MQRYLNDEPVQACPPSALYRFRKFARRNKAALATATVMAVGVLVAVVALAVSRKLIADKAEQLETNNYDTRIALAGRELAAGNVGRAEELLDECPLDRRGWEWHFLKRQRYGNPPPMEHNNTVVRAAFSPDGRQLATALIDGTLSIRDSRTGEVLHALEPPTVLIGGALPLGMAYSLDSRYLAACATTERFESGILAVGNCCTPSKHTKGQPGRSRSARIVERWHPVARIAVCGLWDVTSGQALQAFSAHPAAVKGVAFRPDGQSVVAACDDGTVKVWDRESGRETFSFHGELLMYPWAACVHIRCAATGLVVSGWFHQGLGHDYGATGDQPAEQHEPVSRRRVQPGRQADRHGRLRWHPADPGCRNWPRDAYDFRPQQPGHRSNI